MMSIWLVAAPVGIGAAVTMWALVMEHRQTQLDESARADDLLGDEFSEPQFRRVTDIVRDVEVGSVEP